MYIVCMTAVIMREREREKKNEIRTELFDAGLM
jgi:hypothetical protein